MRGRFAKSVHLRCRLGGHTLSIRRACTPGKSAHRRHAGRAAGGPIRRLVRTLGLKRTDLRSDLVGSSRFHRILQRGREFGDWVDPEAANRSIHDVKAGVYFGASSAPAKDLALVIHDASIGVIRHGAAAKRVSANQAVVGQIGPDWVFYIGTAKSLCYLAHLSAGFYKLLLLPQTRPIHSQPIIAKKHTARAVVICHYE